MTSKNLLFTGALLFLLLVTSCVVYFLERFNPFIHKVAYTEYETLSVNENISQTIFAEKVAIDTIETIENNFSDINTTSTEVKPIHIAKEQSQNHPEKTMAQKKEDINNSKEPEIIKLATKIDMTPIPEHITTSTKEIKKVQKSLLKRKKNLRSSKKKVLSTPNKSKKIIIEPVLLTKELQVSPSGKLYRWDRTFLHDIAQKIKQNKKRYVTLLVTDKDATKRNYVRNIRAYLLKMGISKEQIKIKFKNRKQTNKYVFSDQKRDTIEFSLVERI